MARKTAYAYHPTLDGKPAGAPQIFLTREQAYETKRQSHLGAGPVKRTTIDPDVYEQMSRGLSYVQAVRAGKPGPRPFLDAPARYSLHIERGTMLALVEISSREKRHVSDLIREAIGEWIEKQ